MQAKAIKLGRPGVTRDQVFAAIWKIVEEGGRPTRELVRQALGNHGSPNTLGPLIDEWFAELPQLLARRPPAAANDPSAEAIAGLSHAALASFRQFWKEAMQDARIAVRRELQAEQEALAHRRGELDAADAQLQRDREALEGRQRAMDEALAVARGQAADLHQQLEGAIARLTRAESDAAQLRTKLEQTAQLLDAERTTTKELVRVHAQQRAADAERHEANERRHLGEVELARRATASVNQHLQEALEAKRQLAVKLEEQREAALKLVTRTSEDLAARDRELAKLRHQLADAHAAKERAAQEVSAARTLADANATRAEDLSQALAAAGRTEQDLRSRLAAAEGARRSARGPRS